MLSAKNDRILKQRGYDKLNHMALLGTGNGDGYYGGAFKRVVSKVDWDENK